MTSHNEDEYFARESIEKLRKLHKEQVDAMGTKGREEAKAHFSNRCPSCGVEMQKLPAYKGVSLLRCFSCGGAFVPSHAADQLHKHAKAHEHATVEALIDWIRPEPHDKD